MAASAARRAAGPSACRAAMPCRRWAALARARFSSVVKIKQLLELFVKRDAEDQGQFGGGVDLPRLDRADGVAGDAHHGGQLRLGQPRRSARLLQTVFEHKLRFHGYAALKPYQKPRRKGQKSNQTAQAPHQV